MHTSISMKTTLTLCGYNTRDCHIGSSTITSPVYTGQDPDGNVVTLQREGTPGLGIQWGLIPVESYQPLPDGMAICPDSPAYARPLTHWQVLTKDDQLEVQWMALAERAYQQMAMALAGRCHMPAWQRDREAPVPGWQEAAEKARDAAPAGWHHNDSFRPLPMADEKLAESEGEVARRNAEADAELCCQADEDLLKRLPEFHQYQRAWKIEDGQVLAAAITAVRRGYDYRAVPPADWQPNPETMTSAVTIIAQLDSERAVRLAKVARLDELWDALMLRYQTAYEAAGLVWEKPSHSAKNEFALSYPGKGRVLQARCYAGGPDGPHYHSGLDETLEWLEANASTFPVETQVAYLLSKLDKVDA